MFQTPSAERLVVGVFGGSVADLLVGSAGETLSDAIGALPRFAGREVVVLSIAAPGYKQPQQLMALNYLLALGAHFDVVVNIDGFNDLTLPPLELEPFEAFPLFPRGWYPVASRLSPGQRRGQGRVSFLDRQRRDWAEWSRRAPWRWSLTAGLVWAIGDRWLGSRLAAAERELVEAGPTRRDPQAQGPAAERWPEPDRVEVVVAGWRRSSLQMERLCRGLGIEYLHLLQPSQYVPDSKPMSAAERARAWRADSPHRQVVESHWPRLQAAGAALARQGVPFTDLTAMFADVRAPMYGDDCCHLTRAGNERLARAVADALARVP